MAPPRWRQLGPRLLDRDQQLLGLQVETVRLAADRVHGVIERDHIRTRRRDEQIERRPCLCLECAQQLSLGD
jgi:hypothetical protein